MKCATFAAINPARLPAGCLFLLREAVNTPTDPDVSQTAVPQISIDFSSGSCAVLIYVLTYLDTVPAEIPTHRHPQRNPGLVISIGDLFICGRTIC
jgi:hypothetical protein